MRASLPRVGYRGTSLIRNSAPLGPYSSEVPLYVPVLTEVIPRVRASLPARVRTGEAMEEVVSLAEVLSWTEDSIEEASFRL